MKLNGWLIAGLIAFLLGCGGGGSNSGGPPVEVSTTAVDLSKLVGTYRGSATITVSVDLLITTERETESFTVVATVTSDGKIILDFQNELRAEGPLSSTGTFRINDTLRNAGFSCDGTLTISGGVLNNKVQANISSSGGECSNIKASAGGLLSATKT